MAQCPRCKIQTAYIDRHLQTCDSRYSPGKSSPSVLVGKNLSQARLSHLLAFPGMLIFLVGFTEFGVLSLLAFNIVAPLIYRWNHPASEVVWHHTTEALNFQVLWSAAMWAAMLIFPFFGLTVWPFVWIAGIVLVLFIGLEAVHHGKGRYPVRIPLFHHR
ncbi:MAG: DUF4870 domain-containing protein [Chloroflexi bacterium]|nr:DUF4870 domain-containing protein [Chloroflexota bacterium]